MPSRPWSIALAAVLSAPLLALAPQPAATAQAAADPCAGQAAVRVPGAEMQRVECQSDLSATALSAKGRSDTSDWAQLHSKMSTNPPAGAGLQVDGYFPDDSTNNTTYSWNHDSQFVIRLPANWNGQLVVTGAPGVRKQYANDYIISDWVLSQGYAYASTDKGNNGTSFFSNGARSAPGQAVREWHDRVSELTVAAKQVVAQRYGSAPARTWMTGISNGGYLTRWQLENRPELYDGGVDWEGSLFQGEAPNLLTYLPTSLREYPQAQTDPAARQRMYDVGFEPGSEPLWPDHYAVYWDLTQRVYREAFDPEYDGATKAGTPFCRTGTAPGTPTACDAQYDYATRPQSVRDAMDSVKVTGAIGKPMLTLHGDLDALLPIKTDSDVYVAKLRAAGKGGMHRYYVIEDGNHVDGLVDAQPQNLRPILPCYRQAFLRLTSWVTTGAEPPANQTVTRPGSGDLANTCTALGTANVSGSGPGGTATPTASPSPGAAPSSPPAPAPTVPPSPAGASPTPDSCTAPSLRVLDRTVVVGREARLQVGAPAGTTVQLTAYSRPSTTYRQVREAVVGPDGSVAMAVRPGGNTRMYATVAGCAAQSPSSTVTVSSVVDLAVRRVGPRDHVLSGRAVPARPGQVVSLYAGSRMVAQTRTDSAGRYAVRRSFSRPARLDLQAAVGRDITADGGRSAVRRTDVG